MTNFTSANVSAGANGGRDAAMRRHAWIDTLKGIGITAVVVGHAVESPLAIALIFMFHIPLFFLIGGWLHRESTPQDDYLHSRAWSLLVPYVCYLLILWPLELLSAYPGREWDSRFLIQMLVKPMLLGGPLLKGYAAVFWFVTCYFVTQQVVHYLLRHCTPRLCVLIFSAMLLCAYTHAWLLPNRWLPWNVHTVLFAAPMYYIGYRAKAHGTCGKGKFALASVIVVLLGIGLNLFGWRNSLDLKYLDYGIPLMTLASALGSCALLALLAERLENSEAGKVFAMLGAASMTIMFTHRFIEMVMAKQLGMANGIASVSLQVSTALFCGWLLHTMFSRRPLLAELFIGARRARNEMRPTSMVSGA